MPLLWSVIHDSESLDFSLSYLGTLFPSTSGMMYFHISFANFIKFYLKSHHSSFILIHLFSVQMFLKCRKMYFDPLSLLFQNSYFIFDFCSSLICNTRNFRIMHFLVCWSVLIVYFCFSLLRWFSRNFSRNVQKQQLRK